MTYDGYAALTIKGVAERSNTSVPTIYRRWTSKAELVLDVVFTDEDGEIIP